MGWWDEFRQGTAGIGLSRVGEKPHPLTAEGAAPTMISRLRLEFAKGYGYGSGGGADCRRQPADDAHD